MKAAFLPDRGVVKVIGEDAGKFLNNLVTSNLAEVKPGTGRFAALLTPQGKIIADFLVTAAPAGHGGGLLLDCAAAIADQLASRLRMYNLRGKLTIENLTGDLGVMAVWDGAPKLQPDLAFADPRHADLGLRVLVPQDLAGRLAAALGAELVDSADYDAHRIACGVPRGGVDFIYGDAFPHESNMDRLAGVDFDKGCYIGQEVVSRMQHRGTARTRIVRLRLDQSAPEPGESIVADGKALGTMGSAAGGRGLALMRLDKVADALDAGLDLSAGGIAVSLADPNDAKLPTRTPLL